jgi:hypothetical protein
VTCDNRSLGVYVIFPVFTRFSLPLEHDKARKDIPTWIVTC